jgi:hypothetical protein
MRREVQSISGWQTAAQQQQQQQWAASGQANSLAGGFTPDLISLDSETAEVHTTAAAATGRAAGRR